MGYVDMECGGFFGRGEGGDVNFVFCDLFLFLVCALMGLDVVM